MKRRRKSAADIFQEQNVMLREESEMDIQEQARMPAAAAEAVAPTPKARTARRQTSVDEGLKTSEDLQLEKEPIQVRETGLWFWRRVIVPPNAYVVHTRMNRKDPVTLGLGISFRYNPNTDAYLIVPAAMQTIGVVANCISKEKQGLNILAYVQWQIDDFAIAYRKLDFSDSRDPLAIVNAQLREQAEAAIKDKIATMSIEEVLTDKAPIIEELTARLKAVSEGRNQVGGITNEGLGIKIVTVQIREALVSSERLWQHLQAPFRHQQEKTAQISHLQTQDEIRQKELETRQAAETREAETMVDIERIKQSKQTEASEIRLTEEATRFTKEQESKQQKIGLEERTTVSQRESEQRLHNQAAQMERDRKVSALQLEAEKALAQSQLEAEASNRRKSLQIEQSLHVLAEDARLHEIKVQTEQARLERETTLTQQETAFKLLLQEQDDLMEAKVLDADLSRQRQQQTTQLELEEARSRVKLAWLEQEVGLDRLRQDVRNQVNERDLLRQFIAKLPELAAEMPDVQELKVWQTGQDNAGFDAFSTFLAKTLVLAESLGIALPVNGADEKRGE